MARALAGLVAIVLAGVLAGLIRAVTLVAHVLEQWGSPPPPAVDLARVALEVTALHVGLALGCAALAWLPLAAVRRARRLRGRVGGGGAPLAPAPVRLWDLRPSRAAMGLAWAVGLFLVVGGVLGDGPAREDPVGRVHVALRILAFGVALGALVVRGRSLRPGPRTLPSAALAGAVLVLGAGVQRLPAPVPAGPSTPAAPRPPGAPPRSPDLLLLLVDTLRADHLGCYGYAARPTSPTVDSLAAAGVVFDRAYAQWTRTAPAHASLLTGALPHDHGLLRNGASLPADVPYLAEALSAAGYETAGFVSNPFIGERFGFARGFDVFVEAQDFSLRGTPPSAWTRLLPVVQAGDRVLRRDLAGTLAAEWLERRPADGPPVALVVQWIDPHMPYAPEVAVLERFDPGYEGPLQGRRGQIDDLNDGRLHLSPRDEAHMVARYDGEIRRVDERIRRLLATWRRLRPGRSTLVVLTADHGENMHEHTQSFRHPSHVHDSVARVPLLLAGQAGTGPLPAGVRVPDAVMHVSLPATVLDLLGVEGTAWAAPSLAPLATARAAEALLGAVGSPYPAPGPGAVVESADRSSRRTALVRGRWKAVLDVDPGGERWILRDLREDPGERLDHAPAFPDTLATLRGELEAWLAAEGSRAERLLRVPRPLPEDRLDERTARSLRALGYL